MDSRHNVKIFGLTGGIGTGKSKVAYLLSKFPDVMLVDSDAIAKDILTSGIHSQTIKMITKQDFDFSKPESKARLAQILFSDRDIKQEFQKFIHPLVWQETLKLYDQKPSDHIFVFESAILYEIGWSNLFNRIIAVTCSDKEQYRRLHEDRHMTDEEIELRMNAQLSKEEKVKRADYVIDTTCSLGALTFPIALLYEYLKSR